MNYQDVKNLARSKVWESVTYPILSLIRGPINRSASNSVWNSIYLSVRDSTHRSVKNSICNSIEDSILDLIDKEDNP